MEDLRKALDQIISIHALFAEGDLMPCRRW